MSIEEPMKIILEKKDKELEISYKLPQKDGKKSKLIPFLEWMLFYNDNKEAVREYLNLLKDIVEKYCPESENITLDGLANKHPEISESIDAFLAKHPEIREKFSRVEILSSPTRLEDVLNSILPSMHIKPNNKLAKEITRDFVNEGEIELRVNRAGAKKEITTKVMISYDNENVSLSGRAKFSPYDREVHDAVVTLYVAGNNVVTPEMVYRAMTGKTNTERLSPQAVGAVTRSLDKSRRITVNIDFSQEAQAYNKDCKAKYEGYLFASDKITVTTGGTKKEAYKILRKPILYEYSQVSGQIVSVPLKLLKTSESVRSTDEVIVIRGYLLRQIEGMKSDTFKRNRNITFDGIYKELDISHENYNDAMYKKKTHTVRRQVDAIFKEWIEQGYIKGYCQYKERKAIKGVTIEL